MTNRQMVEIVRNQVPLTLPPETTVQAACKHMHDRCVGATLVTDAKGRLLGIFTGRDALRFLASGKSPSDVNLKQVMTRNSETMPTGCTAIEALRLMLVTSLSLQTC